jgi:hypothetical protein
MRHFTSKDCQRQIAHKDEDFFTALPNELLAHIIKQLPVREICRIRELNRRLRSFVDTNERGLVAEVTKHHLDRIHTEHRLLTDFSNCDIFDVLRRFHSHYGLIWLYMTNQNPVLIKAVETYTQQPLLHARDVLETFFILLEAEVKDHEVLCHNLAIMGTHTRYPKQIVEVICFNSLFRSAQQVLPDPVSRELLELGKRLLCTPPK